MDAQAPLDETSRLAAHLHKVADQVVSHDQQLMEQRIRTEVLTERIENVRATATTREQLDAALLNMGVRMEAAQGNLTLKLEHVHKDLEPIKRGIYWAVTLIVGAVLMAVISAALGGARLQVPK